MTNKDEQEFKKSKLDVKEIRILVDDGLESGLYTSHQETKHLITIKHISTLNQDTKIFEGF